MAVTRVTDDAMMENMQSKYMILKCGSIKKDGRVIRAEKGGRPYLYSRRSGSCRPEFLTHHTYEGRQAVLVSAAWGGHFGGVKGQYTGTGLGGPRSPAKDLLFNLPVSHSTIKKQQVECSVLGVASPARRFTGLVC
jgi:hypothetical protein